MKLFQFFIVILWVYPHLKISFSFCFVLLFLFLFFFPKRYAQVAWINLPEYALSNSLALPRALHSPQDDVKRWSRCRHQSSRRTIVSVSEARNEETWSLEVPSQCLSSVEIHTNVNCRVLQTIIRKDRDSVLRASVCEMPTSYCCRKEICSESTWSDQTVFQTLSTLEVKNDNTYVM